MKNELKDITTEKAKGRFYTPKNIVDNILDLAGYCNEKILRKHVIDNSCGDGAFLTNIVDRYCKYALDNNVSKEVLATELSEFVHGIEIDEKECKKCINNVTKITDKYGIKNVVWDIFCADTLTTKKYDGKMDYVLGNPPYIRVHNLNNSFETVKKFSFAQNGMTDLYLVFYEVGLKMLNTTGVLGYITPNSFFNSVAGRYMRKYVIENNLLESIVNLKHYQAFKATTYTAITILVKNRNKNTVEYYEFDEQYKCPRYVERLRPEDYYISGSFYFSKTDNLKELKKILFTKAQIDIFTVKNGFATLADKFFIGNFSFSDFVIPIIKASTGKKHECFFPYKNGELIPYQELTKSLVIKEYYEKSEEQLKSRSLENKNLWYGFGRSQGINDVNQCKYAINTLIRKAEDIKIVKCDKGIGVYGGLYIITSESESFLRECIQSEDFILYISMLGKYKNGGYYTFSSKDLKIYLEYKNLQREEYKNEQLAIFGNA